MIDGQCASLCTMIDDYTWIGVAKEGGVKRIRFAKGTATSGPGAFTDGPELKQDSIWLKLDVLFHQRHDGPKSTRKE